MWYRVQVKRQAFSAWEDIHGGTDLDQAIAVASQAKSSGSTLTVVPAFRASAKYVERTDNLNPLCPAKQTFFRVSILQPSSASC